MPVAVPEMEITMKSTFEFDSKQFESKEEIIKRVHARLHNRSEKIKIDSYNLMVMEKYDLLVTFFIPLNMQTEDGYEACYNAAVKLTKRNCQNVNISEQELWEASVKNMEQETFVENINVALVKIILEEYDFLPSSFVDEILKDVPKAPLYVASNKNHSYGAFAMFCDSLYQNVSEILGEKFIVLPSSIHEVIAAPYVETKEEFDELQKIVREINMSEVIPDERLSDSVYIRDRDGLHLVIV